MIDKINNNQIVNIANDFSSERKSKGKVDLDNKVDASLQVSHQAFMEEAKQAPAEDIAAIERAKQMILSGKLDSPENIRAAAENMIKFGV